MVGVRKSRRRVKERRSIAAGLEGLYHVPFMPTHAGMGEADKKLNYVQAAKQLSYCVRRAPFNALEAAGLSQ